MFAGRHHLIEKAARCSVLLPLSPPERQRQPRDVDGDAPPTLMLDVTPATEAEPVRLVGDDPEADVR